MDQKMRREKAAALVDEAMRAGADAADAVIIHEQSVSVEVRLGKVEATQSSESDDFSIRVYVGKKVATISANLTADPKILAARAVAMAKVSPENPFEGLAEQEYLVQSPRDLDIFDDYRPTPQRLTDDALAMEEAALAVEGITNSGGAAASYGCGGLVLVTSNGFSGAYQSSEFSRSLSVIAGDGDAMERDYDYSAATHFVDLTDSAAVGQSAALRAIKRLNPRQVKTAHVDVIFDPRVARGIASHLAAMVNGASVVRKSSLLKDKMGEQIMKKGVVVSDNPLRPRGIRSRPFDGEGVEGTPLNVIEDGILKTWLLSSASARELKLKTNGHGTRSAGNIIPESTNFAIEPGLVSPRTMLENLKTGFYVTELFGHGVDLVTGQYSRGASGFWVENGECAFSISGVTLASDLLHMLSHLTPANDLDRRFGTSAPTLLIEGMMLAGQ